MQQDKEQVEVYAFSITDLQARRPELELRRLLTEATQKALDDLKLDPDAAETDIEGGFGGVGEITVLLVLKKVGEIVGAAALAGAGKKAGELIFESLASHLRSRNLIPKMFRKVDGMTKKDS